MLVSAAAVAGAVAGDVRVGTVVRVLGLGVVVGGYVVGGVGVRGRGK